MATSPPAYRIRVKGYIDQNWAGWFDGMTIVPDDNGESVLTGPLRDQAELYGVLIKLQKLNLPLVSLSPVEPEQQT